MVVPPPLPGAPPLELVVVVDAAPPLPTVVDVEPPVPAPAAGPLTATSLPPHAKASEAATR
jgi:hypothetical protein